MRAVRKDYPELIGTEAPPPPTTPSPQEKLETLIRGIDAPMFKEQRSLLTEAIDILQTLSRDDQAEALEGLQNLLDGIADFMHDEWGLDTLFLDEEVETS